MAGEQPDAFPIAPGEDAKAVVLDLVNPAGTSRRLLGRAREARGEGGVETRHTTGQLCHGCGAGTKLFRAAARALIDTGAVGQGEASRKLLALSGEPRLATTGLFFCAVRLA